MFSQPELQILKTRTELRQWRSQLGAQSLGFVPTMGALHEGHLSLITLSKKRCEKTIASIFVNPTQFSPGEDFSSYPRTLTDDLESLQLSGCDAVFIPETYEMYRADASTYVVEEKVSLPLCGDFRPGHFRGVATVVLKLFNLVQPTVAFFGQKDAQQCALIERMVRDLEIPVQIERGPTLRESDGLAMSSRNRYLTPELRKKASQVWKSLKAAEEAWKRGIKSGRELEQIGRTTLEQVPEFQIQYWEVRHPASLERIETVGSEGALMAVAAYLGKTRLIDNLVIQDSSQL